jgi:hypothetical protein
MRLFFQRLAFEKHGEYIGATKQTMMVETAKLTDGGLKETFKSLWDKGYQPDKESAIVLHHMEVAGLPWILRHVR